MKRLTNAEIGKITQLIKEGNSLKQIATAVNKSKTTVYYHFRKIKGRTVKPAVLSSKNEELIGEFIGLFAGDGCVYTANNYDYRTYLCFNITEKEYVQDLIENVLIVLFNKKPWVFTRENRLTLCYCAKNIHKLLGKYLIWDKTARKTYSVQLKNQQHSRKFIIGFIRGNLDSDGYLSEKKISFASVSPGLIRNIAFFLDNFKIVHSVRKYKEKRPNRKDIYHINILKRDFNRFLDLIKPRNIKGLNAPTGIRISERSAPQRFPDKRLAS